MRGLSIGHSHESLSWAERGLFSGRLVSGVWSGSLPLGDGFGFRLGSRFCHFLGRRLFLERSSSVSDPIEFEESCSVSEIGSDSTIVLAILVGGGLFLERFFPIFGPIYYNDRDRVRIPLGLGCGFGVRVRVGVRVWVKI